MDATLQLVWTQMDSPVDGVSECMMQVYKQMLALHARASRQLRDVCEDNIICIYLSSHFILR